MVRMCFFGTAAGMLAIAAVVIAAARYDIAGSSGPQVFASGAVPTRTHTASPSPAPSMTPSPSTTATPIVSPVATVTRTVTATTTASPTPTGCDLAQDASLKFVRTDLRAAGSGPLLFSAVLRNTGGTSAALDVSLALATSSGARYIDRIDLPDGLIWTIDGHSSSRLLWVGDIAPGAEVTLPFVAHMLPGWTDARTPEARLGITIASERCSEHKSKSKATITFSRTLALPPLLDAPTSVTDERGPATATASTPSPNATQLTPSPDATEAPVTATATLPTGEQTAPPSELVTPTPTASPPPGVVIAI